MVERDDSTLTEVEKRLNEFNDNAGHMAQATWGGLLKLIPQVLNTAWDFYKTKDKEVIHEAWAGFLDMYQDAGFLSQAVRDQLLGMKNMAFPLDIVMFMGQILTLGANYLMAVNAPAQSLMLQQLASSYF